MLTLNVTLFKGIEMAYKAFWLNNRVEIQISRIYAMLTHVTRLTIRSCVEQLKYFISIYSAVQFKYFLDKCAPRVQ